jgi:colanic acid/amylovoran biosynthesis glycosyltransferase
VSADKLTGGVGYVLRKFPVLSETFVLEEMLALEELGLPIHIISLDRSRDPRFHENLPRLKGSISYIPDITDSKALIRQNRRAAERYQSGYARTLAYVLTRRQPRLLWRFLQAGCVAYETRKLRLRGLHSHFATHPTTVAMLASMIVGFPYSFTAHAYDIYQHSVNRQMLAEKIARARFVVTVSDFNSSYLASLADGAGDKIVRVYNGIDLDRFSPNGAVPPAPFTLLCVGRLVEKKGHLVLVEACRLLRDRGISFQCWLVGQGGLHARLSALIERWDLKNQVQLLGALSQFQVLARYRASHLFVLPSIVAQDGNREGLPVSIVEALACGLPVVTTQLTGIPEAVRHEQNGLLVPPDDAPSLAGAIEQIIRDQDFYERLRANARDSIALSFDRRQTASKLSALFSERNA